MSNALNRQAHFTLRSKLVRVLASLTIEAMRWDGVSESVSEYTLGIDSDRVHGDTAIMAMLSAIMGVLRTSAPTSPNKAMLTTASIGRV
ncbi:MAG: hypothetical protein ACK5PZ_02870 [Pirellula sp.]